MIDGSHRNECAKVCVEILATDGFVIFDNLDSREFDESMSYFNQGFFRIDFLGLIPSYIQKMYLIFMGYPYKCGKPSFIMNSVINSCGYLFDQSACYGVELFVTI